MLINIARWVLDCTLHRHLCRVRSTRLRIPCHRLSPFSIIYLQAPARAEYEERSVIMKKEEINKLINNFRNSTHLTSGNPNDTVSVQDYENLVKATIKLFSELAKEK